MYLNVWVLFVWFRGKKKPAGRKRDYTPVYWDKYFEKELNVIVGENVSFYRNSIIYC
jgi:hypothetical protein